MMNSSNSSDNGFLQKLTEITETNLTNPKFGVSILAKEMGMSRSNLHRKVNSLLKISVSQFINQVRLKKAKELLRHTSDTVSEVAYNVGFNNVSYFVKCFHEYYGYSPSKVGNREKDESDAIQSNKKRLRILIFSAAFVVVLAAILFVVFKSFTTKQNYLEKTIAVLPPIYKSSDSTNLHILNGIMDHVISDLSMIKDIKKVIPSTSVRKYRTTAMMIPEIANELNVDHIVESSGQVYDDNISFRVSLINVAEHKPIWSTLFNEKTEDIFKLQTEISKKIASGIKTTITPAEQERISKKPTENNTAYDYYLRGSELRKKGTDENLNNLHKKGGDEILNNAISYFEKALEHDNEFALAYAELAITYFFLDYYRREKRYSIEINYNAEKAFLYDPQLDMSLIAKASFYRNIREPELAIPYLEKALQFNPNSYLAIRYLCRIYRSGSPDPEKFMEHALKAIRLDVPANDSIDKSSDYANLSRAFRELGFFKEAELYINKALEIAPYNFYAVNTKGIILIDMSENYPQADMSENYQQAIKLYTEAYSRDSTNVDIVKVLFYATYEERDFASAYKYGIKLIKMREADNREISGNQNGIFGDILSRIGKGNESEEYFRKSKDFAERNKTIYKYLQMTYVYALEGDSESAIEQLRIFSEQINYPYWIIRLIKVDPKYDNIRELPEFKEILTEIETNFWENHERIKALLEDKGLL